MRCGPCANKFPVLQRLFNVELVLLRDPEAAKKRAAAATIASRKVPCCQPAAAWRCVLGWHSTRTGHRQRLRE